jgi:hypothetical protein
VRVCGLRLTCQAAFLRGLPLNMALLRIHWTNIDPVRSIEAAVDSVPASVPRDSECHHDRAVSKSGC